MFSATTLNLTFLQLECQKNIGKHRINQFHLKSAGKYLLHNLKHGLYSRPAFIVAKEIYGFDNLVATIEYLKKKFMGT